MVTWVGLATDPAPAAAGLARPSRIWLILRNFNTTSRHWSSVAAQSSAAMTQSPRLASVIPSSGRLKAPPSMPRWALRRSWLVKTSRPNCSGFSGTRLTMPPARATHAGVSKEEGLARARDTRRDGWAGH